LNDNTCGNDNLLLYYMLRFCALVNLSITHFHNSHTHYAPLDIVYYFPIVSTIEFLEGKFHHKITKLFFRGQASTWLEILLVSKAKLITGGATNNDFLFFNDTTSKVDGHFDFYLHWPHTECNWSSIIRKVRPNTTFAYKLHFYLGRIRSIGSFILLWLTQPYNYCMRCFGSILLSMSSLVE
jgi:hypothetical protein